MSRDGCMAFPRGAMGLSAVVIVELPNHAIISSYHMSVKLLTE